MITCARRSRTARTMVFTLTPADVSDPFGGDLEIYRRAAAEIKAGVQSIIGRLAG